MTKNEILTAVAAIGVAGVVIYFVTKPAAAATTTPLLPGGVTPPGTPVTTLPGSSTSASNPVSIGLIPGAPVLGPVGVVLGAPFTITLPAGAKWAAGAQLPPQNPVGTSGPISFSYNGPQIVTLNWVDSGGAAQSTAITLFTLPSTPLPVQPVNITLVPNYTTTGAIPVAVGSPITISLPAGANWNSGSLVVGANTPVSGTTSPVTLIFSSPVVFSLQWQAADGTSQVSNLSFYSV